MAANLPTGLGPAVAMTGGFQRPALFVLAGGIDPIGAKVAEALGGEAFYMSRGNASRRQPGRPDSGTSMRDMVGRDNFPGIVHPGRSEAESRRIQKAMKSSDFYFRGNDAARIGIPRLKLGNHHVVH